MTYAIHSGILGVPWFLLLSVHRPSYQDPHNSSLHSSLKSFRRVWDRGSSDFFWKVSVASTGHSLRKTQGARREMQNFQNSDQLHCKKNLSIAPPSGHHQTLQEEGVPATSKLLLVKGWSEKCKNEDARCWAPPPLPVLTDSRGWKDGTSSAFITITPGAISNAYVPRPQKLKQLMDLRPVLLFSLAILSNTMFGAGRLGDCTNEIDDVMLYTRPRYMWQDSGQNLHLQRSFFCVHFLFSGVAPWPILNPLEPQSSSLSGSRAWRHNESFSALVDLFGPPSPPVSNCKKNW